MDKSSRSRACLGFLFSRESPHRPLFLLFRGNAHFITVTSQGCAAPKGQHEHLTSKSIYTSAPRGTATSFVLYWLVCCAQQDIFALLRTITGLQRKAPNLCNGTPLQGDTRLHVVKRPIFKMTLDSAIKESSPIFKAHVTHKIKFSLTSICADWAWGEWNLQMGRQPNISIDCFISGSYLLLY